MGSEQQARETIDRLLTQAGCVVADYKDADIHASRGVALREFVLAGGFGFADYLLSVDGKAAGVVEAKKAGATLTGVEAQSGKYSQGLPSGLPAWRRPLRLLHESTGAAGDQVEAAPHRADDSGGAGACHRETHAGA